MASLLARSVIVFVAILGASIATYVTLLGWDRSYDRDPVTGELSGPYELWQVVGCAVVLAFIALAGGRFLMVLSGKRSCCITVTVAAMTIGFTAAWSYGAATLDSTGANLWPIGAVMVAVGVFGWSACFGVLGAYLPDRRVERDTRGIRR